MRTGTRHPWIDFLQQGSAVVFLLLASICLSNCNSGETAWQRLRRTGVLQIGTDATYPPFESIDTATGSVVGFDVDLVQEVCRELGCAPEFIVVPFDGIIAGLVSDKYDMIVSTMTITPERARRVAFTDSYYNGGQALAIPEYVNDIKGVDDLVGHKIGVQLGTTGERCARQIADAEVITFDNIGAAFIDMENGRLDAVISDLPTSSLIVRSRPHSKIVGPPLTSEKYGMAVRLEEGDLLININRALALIKSDGRYQKIYDRWFGPGG